MDNNQNTRKAAIFDREFLDWIFCEPSEIKRNNCFRLWEPDGTIVYDDFGDFSWIAKEDAFKNKDGIWTIIIPLDNRP